MRDAAPAIPIVIMTGLDDVSFAEKMVALGAQDYLVKGEFSGPMLWRAVNYSIARMKLMVERDALVKALRSSLEIKNSMFGILAHDLRTPIGAISGHAEFTEMMESDILSERTRGSLTAIRESAAFMDDLIKDVLEMAVAEAGEVDLIRQEIDLSEVVHKAVSIGSVAAGKKHVRLDVDACKVRIKGDALKIEQVLNNLISNAIKFSNEGDVVSVSVMVMDGIALLSVSDQGAGIPPSIMDNLFRPFVKGNKGTAGERSNGLGLYICLRIVEAHGGRILVDSKEGQGTAVTVILPNAGTLP